MREEGRDGREKGGGVGRLDVASTCACFQILMTQTCL